MLTLLVGGARSGKSALAEELGRRHRGPVVFIATCPRIPGDDELTTRIERHRTERPADWITVEEQFDLAQAIGAAGEAMVIVDCLTTWVGNLTHHAWDEDRILAAAGEACAVASGRNAPTIAISNEVGLGIVPADRASRQYRDLLGHVNRTWVAAADRALFMVAGRALALHDPAELLR